MKCIVGLGNPGNRYRWTRHNVGFLTAELLIERWQADHFEGNQLYEAFRTERNGSDVVIVMPQTYMNNSGFAVREFRQRHEVALDDLLIVFDDFQLPFGTIRLRPKGSDGGHNGMASVIYQLESDLIPRLRLGVAGSDLPERRTHDTMADYVLSPFDASEKDRLREFLLHAHDAASRWLEEGIERTMSSFNRNFFSDADAS